MPRGIRNNQRRIVPIDYTNRDQQSLRRDMDNYARNYYPDIYQNFSENSFESMQLDLLSYLGDNLSFYIDYQANESFLDSAIEFENIRQIGRQRGFKYLGRPSSYTEQSFYCVVPARTVGEGPDPAYYPILKQNTEVLSDGGGIYSLLEDVHFADSTNEIVVSEVDASTGLPSFYAIKAKGQIISGEVRLAQISVGNFQRFRTVSFEDEDFSEILSVFDAEGNRYYEVDHLSQNLIYKSVANRGKTTNSPRSLLRPFVVPRRFVTDFDRQFVKLQFGAGSNSTALTNAKTIDPNNVALQRFGKDYVSSLSFDPTVLIANDKMGIAPANTTLFISYRANTDITSNAAVGSITQVIEPLVQFESRENLDESLIFSVIDSIETENENPVVGETLDIDERELKLKVYGQNSAQKRAVTEQDYVTIAYSMPSRFGAVKRCSVITDPRSAKRNLNMYVISEDADGNLIATDSVIKENLKIWLNRYKMINDTVDILDAKIVNFGVEYSILSDLESNKFDVLDRTAIELEDYFEMKQDIGEAVSITDILKVLDRVDGVVDVLDLKIVNRVGGEYSTTFLDFDKQLSNDGRFLEAPKNVIFELKFVENDIKGIVK